MAEIDGFSLLAAIGKNPDIFRSIKPAINKTARSWFKKILSEKDMSLDRLKTIRKSTGENMRFIVDEELAAAKAKTLAKKIDPFSAVLKSTDQRAWKDHILALASGEIEPTSSPEPKVQNRRTNARLRSAVAEQIKDTPGTSPQRGSRSPRNR